MTHGTEHHLEHAEHVQHQAHNPFDKQVAMTMAITAAVLAAVTMLSHRSHNETLQLQAEANRLETRANQYHTQASDLWNYFQTKKQRGYVYENNLELVRAINKDGSRPPVADRQNKGGTAEVSAELDKK